MSRRVLRGTVFLAVIACVLTAVPSVGEEGPEEGDKLVLVLSGGGARGAAHIGALKVLEQLHIAPDLIVGTSMGSIVGGLYAAGWSPEEIHQLLLEINWNEVFTDGIERNRMSFRRKQDDRPYLIDTRLHFDKEGFHLPSGALGGQSLELLLRSIEARTRPARDFDELPIPYRAVATDIEAGKPLVFDSGSLATAMRASMAIPGAFSPVIYEGHTLVDGGSVANLPVGIAQSLGADSVIAVDISSPLTKPGEEMSSFLDVFLQMNSLVTVGNRMEDVKRLGPGDVYIRPELGDISFVDFDRADEAVEIGAEATRTKTDDLRRFSKSETEWAAFLERHRHGPSDTVHVDRLRLENHGKLRDEIALGALDIETPAELDTEELRNRIMSLFHLRQSAVITFHLEEDDGEEVLVIESPPLETGRNSLQFGVSFVNDFSGHTGYNLTVRHQYLPVNRYGGEWQNVIQLGTNEKFGSQFYQPLDAGLHWFVAPALLFSQNEQEIWVDGEPWAEYRLRREEASLNVGRVLGNWGQFRVGGFFSDNRAKPRIGDPSFPIEEEDRAGWASSFLVDTENTVVFPRSGTLVDLSYTRGEESMGSDLEFEQVSVRASHAWSSGKYSFVPYLEYGDNFGDTGSLFDLFSLGGPGRLSGLGMDELIGEKMAFARLTLRRQLMGQNLGGIRLHFYAGLALEAGNVYDHNDSIDIDSFMPSGTVFVGAETPIGPVLLGYGYTDGRDRVYLAIGDHF